MLKVCKKFLISGLDQEFRSLVEFGEKFRKEFYEKNINQIEIFKDNKFIPLELFDQYKLIKQKNFIKKKLRI